MEIDEYLTLGLCFISQVKFVKSIDLSVYRHENAAGSKGKSLTKTLKPCKCYYEDIRML